MSDDAVFLAVSYSTVPAWLLLLFLPDARVTRTVVHSGLYPVVLGVIYALLLFGDHPGPQGSSSCVR